MARHKTLKGVSFSLLIVTQLQAGYLDDIGVTALRARDASLDGSGVTVAQVETDFQAVGNWQTDPADTGLDTTKFTYFDSAATYPTGTNFTSNQESGHANTVGCLFYGVTSGTRGIDGVAPGVDAIEMSYAGYHPNSIVAADVSTNAKITNYSFVFIEQTDSTDRLYDDYADQYNSLFCNGIYTDANNDPEVATQITSPASSYNCIAVGVVDDVNITSLADGRSKPDIVAPAPGSYANYTSYTTPIVSGAATLLVQSGARNDAGEGTADDATDIRTIKALLLNSATKPTSWSHTSTHPLDTTNGAGILEINQAQLQLAAGQYSEIENDTVTDSGTEHLPPSNSNNITSNTGWNLSTLTNTSTRSGRTQTYHDSTDHYYFNCDAANASTFNLTATLVWNRNQNRTNINNLDLFLYKVDGTLVASSISTVDNVEHLYELGLEPGRYVLQVYKPASGRDSTSETYALAFNFAEGAPVATSGATAIATSSSTIDLSWNDNANNETGYQIERRTSGGSYSTLTTLTADSTSFTDNALEAGTTYEYQIISTNDDGHAPATETSATTYSLLENWRLTYFGSTSNTGDAADDADPEFDGLVNLIEFATGSAPNAGSTHPVNDDQLASTHAFSFTWLSNSTLDFSIGYSEDLSAGFTFYDSATLDADSSPEIEFISSTPIDSEFNTLTYGIRDSVTSDQVFIQLQVNTPE